MLKDNNNNNNNNNKDGKREEKIRKYLQLCYEVRERRDGYKVKVIPLVIGCLARGRNETTERKYKERFAPDK